MTVTFDLSCAWNPTGLEWLVLGLISKGETIVRT